MDTPKLGETMTSTAKRPRPEDSTCTDKVRLIKDPRVSRKSGMYKERLTNMKIDIMMNMIIF
jgi:hypothetical protein